MKHKCDRCARDTTEPWDPFFPGYIFCDACMSEEEPIQAEETASAWAMFMQARRRMAHETTVMGLIIDLNEERHWGDCLMCDEYRRLDHAVAWYCGPTHDEIGSITTEYTDGGIVGGMSVCRGCHDAHYAPHRNTGANPLHHEV